MPRALLLINHQARSGAKAYDAVMALAEASVTLVDDWREKESLSDCIVRHRDDVGSGHH